MTTFTPVGGTAAFEVLHHPHTSAPPKLMLVLRVEFAERSDPDDPRCKTGAAVTIDVEPFSWQEWEESGAVEIDGTGVVEGTAIDESSIYYYGFHNPVDISHLRLTRQADGITVEMEGAIDFTYEGLSRLGQPRFDWAVTLVAAPENYEEAKREYLALLDF